jgi:putative transposase
MGVHAASRLAGFSYVGKHAYSITCCTFARRPLFRDSAVVADVAAQLLKHSSQEHFAVLAYCFMPDHVHSLLEGLEESSDLRRLMTRWKQGTGYIHATGGGGRLWQGGFFDHVLRDEEDRQAVVAYVLANPIRAGLVAHPSDYPYWGSSVWSREELLESLFNRRE